MNYPVIEYDVILPENFRREEKLPLIAYLCDIPDGKVPAVFELGCREAGVRAIVVAAKCPKGLHWENMLYEIGDMLAKAASDYNADPDRISLTGMGDGAYGVWYFACLNNNIISAAAPVCGGGMSWYAGSIGKIPVWAFHGSADDIIDRINSMEMVDKVNLSGGTAKISIFPGLGHEIMNEAYTAELVKWLTSKVRGVYEDEEDA